MGGDTWLAPHRYMAAVIVTSLICLVCVGVLVGRCTTGPGHHPVQLQRLSLYDGAAGSLRQLSQLSHTPAIGSEPNKLGLGSTLRLMGSSFTTRAWPELKHAPACHWGRGVGLVFKRTSVGRWQSEPGSGLYSDLYSLFVQTACHLME